MEKRSLESSTLLFARVLTIKKTTFHLCFTKNKTKDFFFCLLLFLRCDKNIKCSFYDDDDFFVAKLLEKCYILLQQWIFALWFYVLAFGFYALILILWKSSCNSIKILYQHKSLNSLFKYDIRSLCWIVIQNYVYEYIVMLITGSFRWIIILAFIIGYYKIVHDVSIDTIHIL